MFKNYVECPDTGDDRDECKCEKCTEYRATRREKYEEDMEWSRREQSRRVDQEYVRRRQ
jgi:hypothetical protein